MYINQTKKWCDVKVAVVGAGASGVFAALELKRILPELDVVVLERSREILAKVRLSGGGRCNLTHAGLDLKALSLCYPRGGSFLLPLFRVFQPNDTMVWFESRGVALRTEEDGRVFPVTNSSETIIDCLLREMKALKVSLERGICITGLRCDPEGIVIEVENGLNRVFDAVILATGSMKEPLEWVKRVGIEIVPQVPSLFTFTCPDSFLLPLSGISSEVEIEMLGKKVRGPLLITHWGFSGPAVLKLSSLLARKLFECNYEAVFLIDWLPQYPFKSLYDQIDMMRQNQAAIRIKKCPFEGLCQSLWQAFLQSLGLEETRRWGEISQRHKELLLQILKKGRFHLKGMTKYKQEFVTAGGVSLQEVQAKTLEAKRVPGLFFAGEMLDIDGITGGFNLQAAWTTGFQAAHGVNTIYQK